MGRMRDEFQYRLERAYDRGSADAYYGRKYRPHIWLDGLGLKEIPESRMTVREIANYMRGYDDGPFADKDWGEEE